MLYDLRFKRITVAAMERLNCKETRAEEEKCSGRCSHCPSDRRCSLKFNRWRRIGGDMVSLEQCVDTGLTKLANMFDMKGRKVYVLSNCVLTTG